MHSHMRRSSEKPAWYSVRKLVSLKYSRNCFFFETSRIFSNTETILIDRNSQHIFVCVYFSLETIVDFFHLFGYVPH